MVTVFPLMVAAALLLPAKLISSEEEETATRSKAAVPEYLFPGSVKVIVWSAFETVKVAVAVASAYSPIALWVTVRVVVPIPVMVTLLFRTLATLVSLLLKVMEADPVDTGSKENGESPQILLIFPNPVMDGVILLTVKI